jgi:hypothetical protein
VGEIQKPETPYDDADIIDEREYRLARLRSEITQTQAQIGNFMRGTFEHAIHCGGKLTEAKELCEHGEFIPFVESCQMSRKTSAVYMRLYENRGYLPNVQSSGHLSIDAADKALRQARRKADKAEELAKAREAIRGIEIPDRLQILHGDFRDVLSDQPDESVDLIFTDPPYHESALPLWSDLAELAYTALKPGSFLLTYSGHIFLPEVFRRMCDRGLEYYWMLSVDHTHGQVTFPKRHCYVSWKPLIMWRKRSSSEADEPSEAEPTHEWFKDRLVAGDPTAKDYHKWAQPLSQAEKMIKKFCPPGGLVMDPMCGSATIPLAALLNDRLAVGVEENSEHYERAKQRVKSALSSAA